MHQLCFFLLFIDLMVYAKLSNPIVNIQNKPNNLPGNKL